MAMFVTTRATGVIMKDVNKLSSIKGAK